MANPKGQQPDPMRKCYKKEQAQNEDAHTHLYGKGNFVCETDARGWPTPQNRSPLELVVDASNGFIPLWAEDVTLRWRFQERSMVIFRDPPAARAYLRALFGQGLLLWGDAAPVRFTESNDLWDFEIAVNPEPNCRATGCTLASAFFPDPGRHELRIYPTMFQQSVEEQIETMAHEIGHIFGLRHFFAQIDEAQWRSEIFGTHQPFSIMNYGPNSRMTPNDRADLTTLYQMVWSGALTAINTTPVQLMRPFSSFAPVFASGPLAMHPTG